MISLADLRRLAGTLTGARFVGEVGPFVLLQNAPEIQMAGAERKKTIALPQLIIAQKSALIKEEMGGLEVALLPPMSPNSELKVGRAPDNDLILEDPSSSKNHAVLRWENSRCLVADLHSMNGTSVNGIPISTPRVLNDGDVVSFGGTQFVYYSSPRIFDLLSTSLQK